MLHREYILSCLSRGLSYLIVLTIELTSLFGPIKANAKSDKRFVECSVDQVMFFGDHAVDLPNGPAVLGYQTHPLRERVQWVPSKLADWKSVLAIAIIEKTTGRLRSILHLAPLKNGLRRFEWLDLGGMLFGYC